MTIKELRDVLENAADLVNEETEVKVLVNNLFYYIKELHITIPEEVIYFETKP